MADYKSIQLVKDIVEELTAEIEPTDDQFNALLLQTKVVNAYRDVRQSRRYPSYYTEAEIEADMENYRTNIHDLAVYDYNTVGMEWQKINKEDQVSREFIRRSSLFSGVLPLSHI